MATLLQHSPRPLTMQFPQTPKQNPGDYLRELLFAVVKDGKVLDVSELQEEGTGAKGHEVPKSDKGKKKWVMLNVNNDLTVEAIPIISNNYAAYDLAVRMLGEEYAPYSQMFLEQHGNITYTKKPQKSPRAKSPKAKSPKAKSPKAKSPKAKSPKAKSPKTRSSRPKSPRSPRSPSEKFIKFYDRTVADGKLVDVSGLEADGKGVRSMEYPVRKTEKQGVEGLAIVSNNYRGYLNAMNLLGPDYASYAQKYLTLNLGPMEHVKRSKAAKGSKTPKAKTPKTPFNPLASSKLSPRSTAAPLLSSRLSPRSTAAPLLSSRLSPRASNLGTLAPAPLLRRTPTVSPLSSIQQRTYVTPSGRQLYSASGRQLTSSQ